MKKTLSLLLAVLLLMSLCACSPTDGTYYLYFNGKLDESAYMILKGDQWSNDGGMEGRCEIDGNEITLYYVFNNKEEAFLSGTIENGVVTLRSQGMTSTYCKKGSEPKA